MELQIAVEELHKALQRAQGVVEKKSTMPILSNVLLQAGKGALKVTAFDLEIGVTSEHPAEILQEGQLAVSAKHLFDIVRNLAEPKAVLRKTANNYLELRCGASHFKIVGASADDYPALPALGKVPLVRIEPKVVLEMIEKTAFAISHDETRFNLNGVFFETLPNAVRMVSTDGHRLSLIERPIEGDFKLKRGVILPKKGILELKKLLAESGEGETQLGFSEDSALLQRPGLTLVMRLISGHFPDYQQVVPKKADRSVRVGRTRFLDTLKRVSLLSQDQMHTVKIELADGVLRISSQNPDLGEASEEIPIATGEGQLQIGFNARYLMDVLQVLSCEEVSFELHDDLSPGVVRPVGETTYTAVVMPVRI